jgi:hypothetical protein
MRSWGRVGACILRRHCVVVVMVVIVVLGLLQFQRHQTECKVRHLFYPLGTLCPGNFFCPHTRSPRATAVCFSTMAKCPTAGTHACVHAGTPVSGREGARARRQSEEAICARASGALPRLLCSAARLGCGLGGGQRIAQPVSAAFARRASALAAAQRRAANGTAGIYVMRFSGAQRGRRRRRVRGVTREGRAREGREKTSSARRPRCVRPLSCCCCCCSSRDTYPSSLPVAPPGRSFGPVYVGFPQSQPRERRPSLTSAGPTSSCSAPACFPGLADS